jgi:hypothetical protein
MNHLMPLDTTKPPSYANRVSANSLAVFDSTKVNRGHAALKRFFCVQKSMASLLWAGYVGGLTACQLRFTGLSTRIVPPTLFDSRGVDKTTLNRGYCHD